MNELIQLSDDQIKRIQEELLKMLLEIDRICKKHNIKYYLGGGTLLGAVRHGGFIPWDDDADIFFLRKDYDKFLCVVNDELSPEYFFQDRHTDPGAHYIFSKLRRNDSIFVTEFGNKQNMHKGLFLDIFVHDATANTKLFQKLHNLKTHFYRAMQVAKWDERAYTFKPRFLSRLLNRYIRKHSLEYFDEKVYKTVTKYKNKKKKYSYDGTGEHLSHGVFPMDYIKKPSFVDFCGHKLPIPENYKGYLEFSYGPDYMTPPPVEKRRPDHKVVELRFPE